MRRAARWNWRTDSAEAHTSRGGVLSLAGRHEEAEQEFETAVQLGPHLFDAYYLYARNAFAQGKLERAVQLFHRAGEVNPQDYQSPLLIAQCYEHLGRPTEAEAGASPRHRDRATAIDHLTR